MSEQFFKRVQFNFAGDSNGYKTITGDFSNYLKARGHSDGTQHAYHSVLMHFVGWVNKESPQSRTINSSTICAFLQQHLPVCHCPPPAYKELKTARAALNQLLLMLKQNRLQVLGFKNSSAVECTLRDFDDFQRDVCGFTESTRENRQRFVRTFLAEVFGTGTIDSARITAEVLIRFVTDKATHLKPSSVGVLLSALRSFLGMDVKEINADVEDAIGELANMLGGNVKTLLSKNGRDVSLSLPTTITGEAYNFQMASENTERTVVRFESDHGRFHVELQLEKWCWKPSRRRIYAKSCGTFVSFV